jgi:hypothetical protein
VLSPQIGVAEMHVAPKPFVSLDKHCQETTVYRKNFSADFKRIPITNTQPVLTQLLHISESQKLLDGLQS